jgi:hypothetical protein
MTSCYPRPAWVVAGKRLWILEKASKHSNCKVKVTW